MLNGGNDLNLLHLILVFLMIAGLSLSVYGFQKKSQIIMLIGGIVFLVRYFTLWAGLPFYLLFQ